MIELLTPKDIDRFHASYVKTDDCWLWSGVLDQGGRGNFRVRHGINRMLLPHRIAYELAGGVLEEGLVIDHLCENPSCVNPNHLEQVTQLENLSRGAVPSTVNRHKTHCVRGHALTDDNIYKINGYSVRRCRQCSLENQRKYDIKSGRKHVSI